MKFYEWRLPYQAGSGAYVLFYKIGLECCLLKFGLAYNSVKLENFLEFDFNGKFALLW